MSVQPERIDHALCAGCGTCVAVCPYQTLSLVDGLATVVGDDCLECGHCQAACPTGAVTIDSVLNQPLELKTIKDVPAYIAPGQMAAGPLVGLMRSRRSCRKYQDREVPLQVLEDLVRIGTLAPSGTNSQTWTFTLLSTRASVMKVVAVVAEFFKRLNRLAANPLIRGLSSLTRKDELGDYYKTYYEIVKTVLRQWDEEGLDRLIHGAPAAILIGSRVGEASCPSEDALLASQNIMLAAHALGLGTCLVGFVVEAMRRDPKRVKPAAGLHPKELVHAVIAVGYPDVEYVRATGRRQVKIRTS